MRAALSHSVKWNACVNLSALSPSRMYPEGLNDGASTNEIDSPGNRPGETSPDLRSGPVRRKARDAKYKITKIYSWRRLTTGPVPCGVSIVCHLQYRQPYG